MATYDELVAEGDHYRVDLYEHIKAICSYRGALMVSGHKDRHCQQMIGVSSRLLGKHEEAAEWLFQALGGATEVEQGNILRDLAESLDQQGKHEAASEALYKSLALLETHPVEQAATRGFLARHFLRIGRLDLALDAFRQADRVLSEGPNRHVELYNKLHLAAALAVARRPGTARRVAFTALKLACKKDPFTGQRYGAKVHRKRAVMIFLGASFPEAMRKRFVDK